MSRRRELRVVRIISLLAFPVIVMGCERGAAKVSDSPRIQDIGCPGAASIDARDADCSCTNGRVLRAGRMECKDCDPIGSRGAYCDCGENMMFSVDARMEQDLYLVSPQVECVEPSEAEACKDADGAAGAAGGPSSGPSCGACEPWECGVGCAPCPAGDTCVSGTCLYAGVCRLHGKRWDWLSETDEFGDRLVLADEDFSCPRNLQIDHFVYLDEHLVGEVCMKPVREKDERGYCEYTGVVEVLSK